jgi:16S rRNA (cytidine1402-2'-O)-methyltransferase
MSTLWIIATPIGNLGDLTERAGQLLRELGNIACEDTRHTGILLQKIGSTAKLLRYDEHTHDRVVKRILSILEAGGDVGLVSDAGTPGMSDPGARLVDAVNAAGHSVLPVPGPSALTAALSICGFTGTRLCFLGFLPTRGPKRAILLREVASNDTIVVVYESPLRIRDTMADLALAMSDRQAVVCRELTKFYETIYRFPLADSDAIAELPERGEYVVVVSPKPKVASKKETDAVILKKAVEWAKSLVRKGFPKRMAAQQAAAKYSLSTNVIYRHLIPKP